MKTTECLSMLALTHIPGLGLIGAHHLLRATGKASALFEHVQDLADLAPQITKRTQETLRKHASTAMRLAEAELDFAEKNQIACLTYHDEAYPSRLRSCDDAPLVLFFRGNTNLNSPRVINLVGTRHATEYGRSLCQQFLQDLKQLSPDTLIVSGLAYGIDIHAHRAALECGFHTVAVLAHGLDRIYPAVHRTTAIQMIGQGGLLTEYPSGTTPDKPNFIRRNRIIAGMCDATIIVESADKGGALITANIADSYQRDCFAFPGRVGDPFSAGCNHLIQTNRASLLQRAEDLVLAMNWKSDSAAPKAIQRELFPELNDEEQQVYNLLEKHSDGLQINTLVVRTNIPINQMTGILFELEMKGIIRTMAGGMYRLV